MKELKLVSVIIPTHNRAQHLKKALLSVFKQSYSPLEVIVVDDGSTDETAQMIQNHFSERATYLKLSKNHGVSFARNRGIEAATGDWIAFLDSDDEWLPRKIELQMQYLQENSSLEFVHCDEVWIRNGVPVTQQKKHLKSGGRIFSKCIPLCCIGPSAAVVGKTLLARVGLFNEQFPVCEDYDLWLRIAAENEIGFVADRLVVKHDGHENQLSHQYKAMDYWRVKALAEFLNAQNISEDEHMLLKKTLVEKCQLLINGYRKHNNLVNLPFIENVLEKTRNQNQPRLYQ